MQRTLNPTDRIFARTLYFDPLLNGWSVNTNQTVVKRSTGASPGFFGDGCKEVTVINHVA
jgi:hypothetical protein